MSIKHILKTLEKLVGLQQSLLEISKQKTVDVKEGQIDHFQSTLVKERKAVQAIEQVEKKRIQEVNQWCAENSIPEEQATLTGMLEFLSNEEEKNNLEASATELTEGIVKIKQQEELNQVLIQQSMQFIQLSLELLNPSIGNMNYSAKKATKQVERSVFDSKA
ncbi:flagellar protein FlgN [Virgibacillus sp. MSJ-26]|uniref:flagellar protein FlgN n=1 Tax=Virgibacillus sp. MSJ-26 TaxID=2841522 RepID=UPI001C1006FB|nr:flagellar protein FlgN [Virgibacillus sp. MSJ-26]MBU5467798.1 flagellar protein FlgN [Virgibacillus sp. MSJ-26]